MMRTDRGLLVIVAGALALALAGCGSANSALDNLQGAMADFNPFGTKDKPLPGDRKALFPEGVPGVQQGVPQELMAGHRGPGDMQPSGTETTAAITPTPTRTSAPAERPSPQAKAPEAAPKAQKKAAPKAVVRRAPAPSSGSTEPREDAVWPPLGSTPAPAQARSAPPASSPWPNATSAAPPPSPWPSVPGGAAPPPAQASSAPWPAPAEQPSNVWPSPR